MLTTHPFTHTLANHTKANVPPPTMLLSLDGGGLVVGGGGRGRRENEVF